MSAAETLTPDELAERVETLRESCAYFRGQLLAAEGQRRDALRVLSELLRAEAVGDPARKFHAVCEAHALVARLGL